MLGTTLKVGFDASKVDSGLGGLRGKFGRTFRQIGIGAARQVGAQATDLLGRLLMAAPKALMETADWAGNLTDMSVQTKLTREELVLLEEKLRLAGASAADTSMIISRMSKSIYEARTENGAAAESIRKLGFTVDEFNGMDPDQVFYTIGQRVSDLGNDFEGLEGIMSDIFGARMGYKLIRFFKDYQKNSALAEKNIGGLGKNLDKSADDIDDFSDAISRFDIIKKQAGLIGLESLIKLTGGSGGLNKLLDDTNIDNWLRPPIEDLTALLGTIFDDIKEKGVVDTVRDLAVDLGRALGQGIKESMGDMFSPKNFLPKVSVPKWLGGKGDETASLLREGNQLTKELITKSTASFA
jgi:hypothetical protein